MRTDIEQLVQGAGLLLGGGIGGKLLEWVLVRREKRQKEPADLMRAMGEFSSSLSDGGKELIDEFRKEFIRLNERIVALTVRADAAEETARKAQVDAAAALARDAECQRQLAAVRKQIAAMVAASRVAAIGEAVPEGLK